MANYLCSETVKFGDHMNGKEAYCIPQFVTHSPVERQPGCFQVSAVMNKAAINIYMQFSCGQKFSAHLGK